MFGGRVRSAACAVRRPSIGPRPTEAPASLKNSRRVGTFTTQSGVDNGRRRARLVGHPAVADPGLPVGQRAKQALDRAAMFRARGQIVKLVRVVEQIEKLQAGRAVDMITDQFPAPVRSHALTILVE